MAFLHENIILSLSDWVRGEQVHRYLKQFRQWETLSCEERREGQNQRLRDLVSYIASEVPFYHDWFAANSVSPHDIKTVEDLRLLPVVSKELMRTEGIKHFSASCFPEKERMVARSSGSTGEPFSFYVSKVAYSVNTAAKLYTWYQAGYRLGDRYMKIANGARHGRLKKLQDCINNCVYVPFFSMGDETLKAILDRIERTRPTIIRSYPIPLYLLSQYRNAHQGYKHRPRHVMTTGSTLPNAYREEIERAFGCDVIDSYSCEGTPNTYETVTHDGYRVADMYGIIEVLDDRGEPVTEGVGRVVSTDLWNRAHPFLRYDTQDLVEVKDGRIIRIMGRECESLVMANGKRFTVHNFVGFFQEDTRPIKQSVKAYQLVKQRDGSLTFRLVVDDHYTCEMEQYIIDFWQRETGLPVSVVYLDTIPLMNNNKRLTIVEA